MPFKNFRSVRDLGKATLGATAQRNTIQRHAQPRPGGGDGHRCVLDRQSDPHRCFGGSYGRRDRTTASLISPASFFGSLNRRDFNTPTAEPIGSRGVDPPRPVGRKPQPAPSGALGNHHPYSDEPQLHDNKKIEKSKSGETAVSPSRRRICLSLNQSSVDYDKTMPRGKPFEGGKKSYHPETIYNTAPRHQRSCHHSDAHT